MTYPVIAITERDGPIVLVRCDTEAKRRLHAGDYFSSDVRDIALGEDPALRQSRGAGSAERPGNWAAAIEQFALL